VIRIGRSRFLPCLLAVCLGACSAPEPGPVEAAREMFRLARERPPAAERVDALFGSETRGARRAALLDALEHLAGLSEPQLSGVETMSDLRRTAVDLYAELPGGGIARFSVQLEAIGDEGWRVRWFRGPGVEWPPARPRRDEGLSSSAPPAVASW
jgi:hypothetical protein